MQITATALTSGISHGEASGYDTGGLSPTPGKMVLISIWGEGKSGGFHLPTVSGCNLTWTQVATVQGNQGILTILRAVATNPTPGALHIDWSGQTQFNCAWVVDEILMDVSGTNGSNAIQQSGSATNNTPPPVGSLTINMSTFQSLINAGYGVCGLKDGRAISFNSPYVFVNGINDGSDIQLKTVLGLNTSNNANFLQFTWSTVEANNRALGLELKSAPDGGILLMNFL